MSQHVNIQIAGRLHCFFHEIVYAATVSRIMFLQIFKLSYITRNMNTHYVGFWSADRRGALYEYGVECDKLESALYETS